MTPILIACLAGSGSTLTGKVFDACGMWSGNERTFWMDRYSGEHSLMSALVQVHFREDRYDKGWRFREMRPEYEKLCREAPGDMEVKIRHILRRYVSEAKKEGQSFFGFKMVNFVSEAPFDFDDNNDPLYTNTFFEMVDEIWGNGTVFVSTIRDPVSYIDRLTKDPRFLPTKGVHVVRYYDSLSGWHDILDRGGIILPYPQAFDDDSIKKHIDRLGLQWTPRAREIYISGKPTRMESSIEEFRDTFELADKCIEGYNEILERIGREDCIIHLSR